MLDEVCWKYSSWRSQMREIACPLNPSINKEIDTTSSVDNPPDKMKRGPTDFGVFRSIDFLENPIGPTSGVEQDHSTDDEQNEIKEHTENQLMLYDPLVNGAGEFALAPDPIQSLPPSSGRSGVYRSIGDFTVQCANCFKWRLIPNKEKYEEIREHILEDPFFCEIAREWRPEISCDDPPDITQDGSRLWAIDKPNIALPPTGWERLLRIRGEGGTRFADVYYKSPTGRRFRSMVEIEKYLEELPECARNGISISQFSFQTPKPLQKNYVVKKRPSQSTPSHDDTAEVNCVGRNKDSDVKLSDNPNAGDIESLSESTNKKRKLSKGLFANDS